MHSSSKNFSYFQLQTSFAFHKNIFIWQFDFLLHGKTTSLTILNDISLNLDIVKILLMIFQSLNSFISYKHNTPPKNHQYFNFLPNLVLIIILFTKFGTYFLFEAIKGLIFYSQMIWYYSATPSPRQARFNFMKKFTSHINFEYLIIK